MSPETKTCQNCKSQFTIEPEDFQFYEKMKVPPPTWCPECRMVRRFVWRAGVAALFRAKCHLCSKSMLSMYDPESKYIVYCRDCWHSDKWDPLSYGVDYDFSKPFFIQFQELQKRVPRPATFHLGNTPGCEYGNFFLNSKNSYLSSSVVESENVFYSNSVDGSKDVVDSLFVKECEYVYENFECARNHECLFMVKSRDCINSAFLFDCANCQDCFMSSNLRNRKYVIRNRQYTKEEYDAVMKKEGMEKFGRLEELKKEFTTLRESALCKYANIIKAAASTGDNLESVNRVKDSFDVYGAEDVRYSMRIVTGSKDLYDVYGAGRGAELLYEGMGTAYGSTRSCAISFTNAVQDASYVDYCGGGPLFGCIAVRSKANCIFNKQYSKEEYFSLVEKIKKHMEEMPYINKKGIRYGFGEFFPPEMSPFAYNNSYAHDWLPLSKDEALLAGFTWKDEEERNYGITKMPEQLPDSILEVKDDILNEIIGCAHRGACKHQCTRAFRFTSNEIAYYRHWKIPLPRLCPNCRHHTRMTLHNPLKLWARRCGCHGKASALGIYQNASEHFHGGSACPNEFETSYPLESRNIVYCEQCYNSEVV